MDNNLSIVTAERVVEILKDETNSGISRLDRIKVNNPDLFNSLGCPEKVTKKLAENLIKWSKSIYIENSTIIDGATNEIKNYSEIIERMIHSINYLDLLILEVINYKYESISHLLPYIGVNSKLTTRINNLKLLAVLYNKDNLGVSAKKFLFETLINEIFFQKSNIFIFENNMNEFTRENFALGLLLYDIPASPKYELDFLTKLKNHGIKC